MTIEQALKRLEAIDREVVLLSHINGVLVWDQETVPPGGTEERSRQVGLLERKMHELSSSDQVGEILATLGAEAGREEGSSAFDERTRGLVRWYYRTWARSRKLDADFVQEFSETTAQAHQTWAAARRNNDFSLYEPVLSRIIEMVRRKADAFGYSRDPYDPLLDVFEPGTTTAEVEQLFGVMRRDLQDILFASSEEEPVDDTFLYGTYAQDKQATFAKEILDAMGFDWNRGVSGVSTHPFTISLGSDDIRITTRFTEPSVISPLFSSIHEAGHALYEMGASNELTRGTSLANGASFAFHESQSRLWENMIGRSRAFWSHFLPRMKELFPIQLEYVDLNTFMKAVNRVRPSNIRVDADEVTYGLHIILRFELERELLGGNLAVSDLPGAWNEKMEHLLGIRPESDRVGVLQDVHWSMGEFGYFPTYALGNLYGAQILHTMERELNVDAVVSTGEFTPIRQWLDRNILRFGAIHRPKDLLERVTGAPLDARYFRQYLTNKYLGER